MDDDYINFVKRMGSFEESLDGFLDDRENDELKHHGVKGMTWGVTRSESGSQKMERGNAGQRIHLITIKRLSSSRTKLKNRMKPD